MPKTIEMRRITETNNGYHVRFYAPVKEQAWFPFKTRAEKRAALAKAKEHRDTREAALGLTAKDYGSRRPRKHHGSSKADTGVFIAMGYKNDRFYADVLGVLNYTDDNGKPRRRQRAVSILKHGYHAAYVAAIEARCNLAETELPATVVVPKLDKKKVDLLLLHGVTRKQLTDKAVVHWTGDKV